MINGKKVLALIPARGGSKGLPEKNKKEFNGKPLIAWSIEHGLKSEFVDKVVVTTDDLEIAEIGRKYGAEVPFMRPQELASDTATSMDVIVHALDFLKAQGEEFELLMLLEPTSPLREVSDIDNSLSQLESNKQARSIAGVCEVEAQHPDFLVKLEKGLMRPFTTFEVKRRQELSELYFFEGTVYAAEVEYLRESRTFYGNHTLAYVVSKQKSIEIDDEVDFVIAEVLMKVFNKN